MFLVSQSKNVFGLYTQVKKLWESIEEEEKRVITGEAPLEGFYIRVDKSTFQIGDNFYVPCTYANLCKYTREYGRIRICNENGEMKYCVWKLEKNERFREENSR